MTDTEKKERMEKIEELRFYLVMKDHWDSKDFRQDNEWFNEWLTLKHELERK